MVNALAENLKHRLDFANSAATSSPPPVLICDAGYGVPRESRPRKEKILAIARQLVNFLQWQKLQKDVPATIKVVACQDESLKQALEDRTRSLLHEDEGDEPSLPQHLSFSCQPLEDACHDLFDDASESVVYLSPDAGEAVDPTTKPPRFVVIGLLIDRRIQPHRSQERASALQLVAKRWPLDDCFQEISANEPLNVDCILEGMQQWWWNSDSISTSDDPAACRETFLQAATQAIQHHAERHPSRPVHKRS